MTKRLICPPRNKGKVGYVLDPSLIQYMEYKQDNTPYITVYLPEGRNLVLTYPLEYLLEQIERLEASGPSRKHITLDLAYHTYTWTHDQADVYRRQGLAALRLNEKSTQDSQNVPPPDAS